MPIIYTRWGLLLNAYIPGLTIVIADPLLQHSLKDLFLGDEHTLFGVMVPSTATKLKIILTILIMIHENYI